MTCFSAPSTAPLVAFWLSPPVLGSGDSVPLGCLRPGQSLLPGSRLFWCSTQDGGM